MHYRLSPLQETSLAKPVRGLSLIAIPVLLIAILATRSQQIDPASGVVLISIACIFAAIAIALGVVAIIDIWQMGRTGLWRIAFAMLLSMLVLSGPVHFAFLAIRLPPLRDISTDIEERPRFSSNVAFGAVRGGHNHPEPDKASHAKQRRAYPAIRPLMLDMPVDEATPLIRTALQSLKWQIMRETQAAPPDRRGENGRDGHFEAVVQSPFLRMKHDVVIRLRPIGNQVKVDIRSASRFWRHDFGANAAHILRLIDEIKAQQE